jgi:hypothetical protein
MQCVTVACAMQACVFQNSPSGLFFLGDYFVVVEEIGGFVK